MTSQIDELVKMRDITTLYELLTESDEWLTQLEAAEGLVKLNDRRGYEFLTTAMMSDDEDILEVAKEILDSPDLLRMKEEMEAERRREHQVHIEAAKKRIQVGGKVFLRLLTMMVVPLMTCSARLPVYGLLIAALVPVGKGSSWMQGLLLAGMYL